MPKPLVVQDFSFDMHTFFGMPPADRRPHRRRSTTAQTPERTPTRAPKASRLERVASEDGFLLIEVVVSALLVALIVVATFSGFDSASRVGVDQRNHDEATLLANESQEALRSDPASTFNSPKNNFEHSYTKTLNGTTFTVTQKASFLNGSGESTSCSATSANRQETNSLKITSSVTWALLKAAERPPVTESSTSTPPAGSTLEVDVGNLVTPTSGVPGVGTVVNYTPEGKSSETTLEGTTEGPGCVVFASIPSTAATVEVLEKAGFVTPAGEWHVEPKEVAIAPNYTTHHKVTLNEGSALQAEFTWKGSNKYTHGSITEPVTASTFVAYNEEMGATPEFELGDSGKGKFSSGTYTVEPNVYEQKATTPKEPVKYPNGNLFPFPAATPWKVYAGACTSNDPHKLNAAITDPLGVVTAGASTPTLVAKVPTAYMKLNVYKGTQVSEGLQETTAYPITITNTACKNITPDNQGEVDEPQSEQKQTTSSSLPGWGGHLEHAFFPLGAGRLCLAYNSGTKHYTYTTPYNLTTEGPYERNIFLGKTGRYTETIGSEAVEVEVAKQTSGVIECQ
jgi:type II secretory pathway pseudopilin PulG